MKLVFIFLTCLFVVALTDDEPEPATAAPEEVTSEPQTSEVATPALEAETPVNEEGTTLETTAVPGNEASETAVSIVETTAAPAMTCDSWPPQLRPLRECCEVPDHTDLLTQNICHARCTSKSREAAFNCILGCYISRTHLIKRGVVDKAVVKKLYEKAAYDYKWRKIIEAGVGKCEYTATGSLNEDLATFFNCVNDHLAENCINFIETTECDAVQEHFETCNNMTSNCATWPPGLLQPDGCCSTPSLSTGVPNTKCQVDCRKKEMFLFRQVECELNCTRNATGLTTADGAIDFAVVKKLLTENANKTLDWEKPIEFAVEACEKVMAELYYPLNHLKIMHLEHCLSMHLSEKCVDFRSESYCNKTKRFMKQCPGTIPLNYGKNYDMNRYNRNQHHG